MARTIRSAVHQPSPLMAFMLVMTLGHNTSVADVLVPLERGDKLTAAVDVVVTHDDSTNLYKYSYAVTNASDSLQSATNFMLGILPDTTVMNAQSPHGWDFVANPYSPYVSWFAAEVDDEDIPVDWDGEVLPSSYVIKPGETLSGFSFESIVGPAEGDFYVQGWTPIPVVTGDIDELVDAGYDLDDQSPFVASRSQGLAPMVLDAGSRK